MAAPATTRRVNNANAPNSTDFPTVNIDNNYGLCDHDVRYNFNVGGVYRIPGITVLAGAAREGLANQHYLYRD